MVMLITTTRPAALRSLLAILCAAFFYALPLHAQTVVTSTANTGAGSLREALASGSATVTFAPSLAGATIAVGEVLVINRDVTVQGNGVILDGGDRDRVLYVGEGRRVVLRDLTVQNGRAPTMGAGGTGRLDVGVPQFVRTSFPYEYEDYACDTNDAPAWETVKTGSQPLPSRFGCRGYEGGGLYVDAGAEVTLERTTFTANRAGDGLHGVTGSKRYENDINKEQRRRARFGGDGGNGGAVFIGPRATLTVRDSRLLSNSAGKGGNMNTSTRSEADCDEGSGDLIGGWDHCDFYLSGALLPGTGGHGGALYALGGTVMVERSELYGNMASARSLLP